MIAFEVAVPARACVTASPSTCRLPPGPCDEWNVSLDLTQFIERVENRETTVGVVGLGYVGLPLVMEFCRAGFRVLGFDIDPAKVEALNAGRSYIEHIPSSEVAKSAAGGLLQATTDFARARQADAILICVPTPLDDHNEPDLSFVVETGETLGPHIRQNQLVVLESTTYPGTTREILLPALEVNGYKAGTDFYLAYSPEREDPGNPSYSTSKIPKVVAGLTPQCRQAAQVLYGAIVVSTVPVSSLETAEAVKLLENIFRATNIALVNELKLIYEKMGIDVWEVIDAASTKPFGFMPFYPGPGLGGHCIPIDPFYLSWRARQFGMETRFIELAGDINTSMPMHVVERLSRALVDQDKRLEHAKVLVLGAAYKANVGDPRESPGIELMVLLRSRGATVDYSDPHVPRIPAGRKHDLQLESVPLTSDTVAGYDAVLIATDHAAYDYAMLADHAQLIIDTRNAMKGIPDKRGVVRKA